MVVCIECSSEVESLYKIYGNYTIQINKCNKCGNIVDKYQKCDSVLLLIGLLLLKKPFFRHILNNCYDNKAKLFVKRKHLNNYLGLFLLFILWSTLDAYKYLIIQNCKGATPSVSLTEKFLNHVYQTGFKTQTGFKSLSLITKSKDKILDENFNLATNTIDHLLYIFYKITHFMLNEGKGEIFDCKSLNTDEQLPKIYKYIARQEKVSIETFEILRRTLINNTLTILLTAVLASIVTKNKSKFIKLIHVCTMSMYGKTFTLLMIIWKSDIYIDIFIHIYVIYTHVITLHIYLNKPYTLCLLIALVPRIVMMMILP